VTKGEPPEHVLVVDGVEHNPRKPFTEMDL
jgi:hypothetical protein